jgi:hypothetical protein
MSRTHKTKIAVTALLLVAHACATSSTAAPRAESGKAGSEQKPDDEFCRRDDCGRFGD